MGQALASLGPAHGLMELAGAFHTGEQTRYLLKEDDSANCRKSRKCQDHRSRQLSHEDHKH